VAKSATAARRPRQAPLTAGHNPPAPEPAAPASESATRRRILEAGIECLAQYGNERTTLQDVADAAGVARNTVYRHFADRTQLLTAIAEHEHQRQADEVRRRTTPSSTLEEVMTIVVEVIAETVIRYRTRQHLKNLDRGHIKSWFLRRHYDAEFLRDLLRPHVQRAQRDGQLADGVSTKEAIDWIVVTLSTVSTPIEVVSFDPDNPDALARFYARRACQGLTRH
jgi:AcrR family transcriptional regulator